MSFSATWNAPVDVRAEAGTLRSMSFPQLNELLLSDEFFGGL